MEISTAVIHSEEDALRFVEMYIAGQDLPDGISFEGWPNLTFRLTGDKFHGSLTPSVMKGFVEMQAQINRAYALLKYGVPDPRKLSKEEKEAIEIQVNVENGSSLIEVNMDGFMGEVIQTAVSKVGPQEIVITVLGVALIWGGVVLFKKYLEDRKEIRMAEVKSESEREHLATMRFMSEQETKRSELLTQLIKEKPKLDNMERLAHDAKTDIVKSFVKADTAQIDGVVLDADLSKNLTTNARRKSMEIRLDGNYRIEKVDSTDPESFKVQVRNVDSDLRISCIVQDVFLDASEHKKALQHAEWDRKPVHLSINAKELDGEIKSAIILYVKEIT
ncbi:hypothetical protein GCI85_23550 [Salmonella enterica subsp. enterica serovar Typhi]|uniref:Uncharacterized protein n=5 Tax=Salmonella enterica I TaxID=59201 RepID=A0A3Z6T2R3_SALTI|nr:hypothetical protein [Salmonella enterica]ECC9132127.1 hypothetical protein [Salmonella enterica subsp. enterica serovar Paratyphi A]EDG8913211.1 hypothetical protein [Salmonella enterica subsp. enterica serovar Typhimurium]EDT3615782.1 hypothetical protein [Salmonella enterica subsp. enterica serovar Java]EDT6445144.1 hypothetical protein [Salmonella enterica subsp. enterica]EGB1030846.1 hypothetical protein [Salmonella enterica subsp. enterica serovar Reading]EHB5594128.1 hypothetical pr